MALKAGRHGVSKKWVDALGNIILSNPKLMTYIIANLPTATRDKPGVITVGTYLNIDNGVLSGTALNQKVIDILGMIAPSFTSSKTYEVGDLVAGYTDRKLYRCIVAITTPHEFNETEWAVTSITEEFARKEE